MVLRVRDDDDAGSGNAAPIRSWPGLSVACSISSSIVSNGLSARTLTVIGSAARRQTGAKLS
jgi:hypothetical protein